MEKQIINSISTQINDNENKTLELENNLKKLGVVSNVLKNQEQIANSNIYDEIDYAIANLEVSSRFQKVADQTRTDSDKISISNNNETIVNMIEAVKKDEEQIKEYLDDPFIGESASLVYETINSILDDLNNYKQRAENALSGNFEKIEEEIKEEKEDEELRVIAQEPVINQEHENRFQSIFSEEGNEEPLLEDVSIETQPLNEDLLNEEVDEEVREENKVEDYRPLENTQELKDLIADLHSQENTNENTPSITEESVFNPTYDINNYNVEDEKLSNLLVKDEVAPTVPNTDSGEAVRVTDIAPWLSDKREEEPRVLTRAA